MRTVIAVGAVLVLVNLAEAQTISETLATSATVVDVGVEYSCRQTEQRGWIRWTTGVLPAADVIQAEAKARLCAQISADYLAASTEFTIPDGMEFPLRVDVVQKGIVDSPTEDTIMGTTEVTCP